MNHINDLFSKLKSSFATYNNKKEIVIAVCLKHAGTKLADSEIEINSQFVRLNANPSAKSAIFMKKAAILEEINQQIKPSIVDIR